MDKNNRINQSFALIELIIAVSIIIIFTGLTIPFYNRFTTEQQLKNEGKNVVNLLELARKKAISGDLANYSCPSNTGFTGYLTTVTSNNLQIRLCCGNDNNPCSTSYQITTYNLPAQILVTAGLGNFQFKNLTGQTNQSSQLTVTIKQTAISKCTNIYVSPSGLINFDSNLTNC
jgi:Tfp pilus assembly protein FimT